VATEFAGRERSLTPHTRAVFEARLEEVRSQADFISHQELSAPFAERLPGLLADDGRLVLVLCRRA